LLLIQAAVLGGCGSETDTQVVDFSETIQVARPGVRATPEADSLTVAVAAMVSPRESFVYYRDLLDHIGRKLGKDVRLVQRKTYQEINQLLGEGKIDVAFICSGPYASGRDKYGFELVAAPVVNGSSTYQSYLIVNSSSPYQNLEDLRGRTFAFTDRDSNTGRLVPLSWLKAMNEDPDAFFGKTVLTYSHDNSIVAVAKGLVDGAAVDGLIWEYINLKQPNLTSRTRVVRKSDFYGIPPVVASRSLPAETKDEVRKLLLSIHEEAEGRRILEGLMIDRFVEPDDRWYDSIREMLVGLGSLMRKSYGAPQSEK